MEFSHVVTLLRTNGSFDEIISAIRQSPSILTQALEQHLPYSALTREKEKGYYGKSTNDMSILHLCLFKDRAENEILEVIDEIVKLANSIDMIDAIWGEGNTALHLASAKGLKRVVRRLLDVGATYDPENLSMNTPSHIAANDEIRNMLVNQAENDPEVEYTPAYLAILGKSKLFSGESFGVVARNVILENGGSVTSSPARSATAVSQVAAATASPVTIERQRLEVSARTGISSPSVQSIRVAAPTFLSSPAVVSSPAPSQPETPVPQRRLKTLRNSLGPNYHQAIATPTRHVDRVIFNMVSCRQTVSGLKEGAKVRIAVTIAGKTQMSMEYRFGKEITCNFEASFPVDKENDKMQAEVALIRIKERTNATVRLAAMVGRREVEQSQSEVKEIKLATAIISKERLMGKPNEIERQTAMWLSQRESRVVTGHLDLLWYFHTDSEAPKIPHSLDDAKQLLHLRQQRDVALSNSFGRARVSLMESQGSRLHDRELEARDSKLFLSSVGSNQIKEVIELNGYTGIRIPSVEEIALTNAFTVNTATQTWYFRTSTRAERDEVVAMIQKMMSVVKSAYLPTAVPLSPIRPQSALRNVIKA